MLCIAVPGAMRNLLLSVLKAPWVVFSISLCLAKILHSLMSFGHYDCGRRYESSMRGQRERDRGYGLCVFMCGRGVGLGGW